jgi:hypothetical protein
MTRLKAGQGVHTSSIYTGSVQRTVKQRTDNRQRPRPAAKATHLTQHVRIKIRLRGEGLPQEHVEEVVGDALLQPDEVVGHDEVEFDAQQASRHRHVRRHRLRTAPRSRNAHAKLWGSFSRDTLAMGVQTSDRRDRRRKRR